MTVTVLVGNSYVVPSALVKTRVSSLVLVQLDPAFLLTPAVDGRAGRELRVAGHGREAATSPAPTSRAAVAATRRRRTSRRSLGRPARSALAQRGAQRPGSSTRATSSAATTQPNVLVSAGREDASSVGAAKSRRLARRARPRRR